MRRAKKIKATKKRRTNQTKDLKVKEEIHERDMDMCVVPLELYGNHGGPLQAAHVYPKGQYTLLRHVPENLLSMCWRHHFFWAHKNPIEFTDWWRKTYPEREAYLRKLMQMDKHAIRAELETNSLGE